MSKSQTSRRMFLRGLGGYSLAIPFLPSLAGKAHAAEGASPLRFAMALGKFGREHEAWYPRLGEGDLTSASGVRVKKLSEIQGPLSHALTGAFDPIRSKIGLLRGLDSMNYICQHNTSLPTTGCSFEPTSESGFGYSIDCVLEESKKFYPAPTMVGALRVCPHTSDSSYRDFSSYSFTSKARQGQSIRPEWSAAAVYNKLLNPANVQLLASRNTRIRGATQLVMENFRQVMSGPRIGADDRRRLDHYMSLVSEIDGDLAVQPPQCAGVSTPGSPTTASDVHKAMFKMEAAALACGVTRIAMHSITHFLEDTEADQGVWHSHVHLQELEPGTSVSFIAR